MKFEKGMQSGQILVLVRALAVSRSSMKLTPFETGVTSYNIGSDGSAHVTRVLTWIDFRERT